MVEGVAFGEGEGGMEEVHQVFVWSDFFRHLFCRIYNSTALSKRIFNPLYFALQMLIFNAVGLQIRQNKGTRALLTSHIENCAKRTTSSFLIPTSNFKTSTSPLATTSYFQIPTSNIIIIIMKIFKDMKTWKTIIQFIITVLTAIISSFFVQSCKTGF